MDLQRLEGEEGSNGERRVRSVLMLRLGGLDKINELYGYGCGSGLLRRFGRIIQEHLGDGGQVYRMPGTEFAVLSTRHGEAEMRAMYGRIREDMPEAMEREGIVYRPSVAGGLLVRMESLGEREVYECVRSACNASALERRGNLVVCQGEEARDSQRLSLLQEIRRSIVREYEDFSLLYQPVYDGRGERLIGAEALLCWEREGWGTVLPLEELPELAEEPIFLDLSYWFFRNAVRDAASYRASRPDFLLYLNLFPVQALDPEFPLCLRTLAEEYAFPSGQLCLFLSRQCRRMDRRSLQALVSALHPLEVRIGMDDYGEGDAWLEILRGLPMDYVRLAASFLSDFESAEEKDGSVVASLAQIAVSCGAKVCAKGVDSPEAAGFLRSLSVFGMQGGCFCKTAYFDEILEML